MVIQCPGHSIDRPHAQHYLRTEILDLLHYRRSPVPGGRQSRRGLSAHYSTGNPSNSWKSSSKAEYSELVHSKAEYSELDQSGVLGTGHSKAEYSEYFRLKLADEYSSNCALTNLRI